MTIPPILPPTSVTMPAAVSPAVTPSGEGTFGQVLSNAIQTVESQRAAADQSVQAFLTGEGGELHSTILSTQRAELSMELFLQIRNKVVQAYQEIMRSQL